MTIVAKCDRCDATSDPDDHFDLFYVNGVEQGHLCSECRDTFNELLNSFFQGELHLEAVPETGAGDDNTDQKHSYEPDQETASGESTEKEDHSIIAANVKSDTVKKETKESNGGQKDVAEDPSQEDPRVKNIREAMSGQGWMTADEIVDAADLKARSEFHAVKSTTDLQQQIDSKKDPDDGRRKLYRFGDSDGEDNTQPQAEEDSGIDGDDETVESDEPEDEHQDESGSGTDASETEEDHHDDGSDDDDDGDDVFTTFGDIHELRDLTVTERIYAIAKVVRAHECETLRDIANHLFDVEVEPKDREKAEVSLRVSSTDAFQKRDGYWKVVAAVPAPTSEENVPWLPDAEPGDYLSAKELDDGMKGGANGVRFSKEAVCFDKAKLRKKGGHYLKCASCSETFDKLRRAASHDDRDDCQGWYVRLRDMRSAYDDSKPSQTA